jgi:exonuclease SbcC
VSASVGTASFVSASAESADTLSDRLGALLAGADHDVTATLALADAAALADRRAAEALAAAVRRHDHRDRGERARAQLAVLTAGHAIQESRRSQLDAARRAQRVSGHVVAWRRALASVVSAEQAMAHTEPRLTAAALPSTAADLGTAAQRVHALDDVAHELVSLQRRRDSLESRLGAARAEEVRLTDRVRVRTARVAELTEQERRAREQWAEDTRTAPDVESARGALRHVAELTALCDLVAEDEAEVARLRDGLRVVRDEALAARSRHLDLRERHLDGMAAELAAGLHDGQPCPVCGSEEHPHVAASADPVRREDLAHAERLALAAAATVTETEVALAGVVARASERRSHLGDTDRATLDLRRARAEDDLAHAESAAIALAEDAAALDAMTAALVGERTALQTAEIEAAASSGTVATIAAELERIAQEEQTRRGEHAACPCRADDTSDAAITTDDLAHHDAIGRLIRLALQAHERLAQARAQASSIEQEMLTALRDEGFDTVAAAESARLTADEMAAVEQSLARHDADLASAQAVLADPDVEAALAGAVDDLDALREAESTTRRALLAVTRSQSSAQARLEMLGRLVPTAVEAAQRRDRLAREALRVRDLADTVGGLGPGNARRMRLTAYVLAARLERVVAFANDRLAVLGSGRYLLEHTDEKVGATRSGLGLRVLDQWTGQARDTSSLSGGETFMASLALALGLADAVRAESGGHDLGTLFVDEGFGSLDDESLEEVMAVLDGLQDGGRTVGVVSHVADLRARIPRQLRVRKTPDGSFVSVSPAHPAVAAS